MKNKSWDKNITVDSKFYNFLSTMPYLKFKPEKKKNSKKNYKKEFDDKKFKEDVDEFIKRFNNMEDIINDKIKLITNFEITDNSTDLKIDINLTKILEDSIINRTLLDSTKLKINLNKKNDLFFLRSKNYNEKIKSLNLEIQKWNSNLSLKNAQLKSESNFKKKFDLNNEINSWKNKIYEIENEYKQCYIEKLSK